MQEVSLYKGVLNIVKNFAKNFKNFNDIDTCLEDGTYSLIFDKNGLATSLYGPVEIEDDFACITFHQNGKEDPFNEQTDESYAKLITIFFKELEKIGFEKDRIKLNVGFRIKLLVLIIMSFQSQKKLQGNIIKSLYI